MNPGDGHLGYVGTKRGTGYHLVRRSFVLIFT